MDHIPLPQAPNSDHIEVSFYEDQLYPYIYSGPWNKYPERKGYAYAEFYAMDSETYPKCLRNPLAAFVQSWLFFGCLTEFLGLPCPAEEWTTLSTQGGLIITTARLYEKLEDWRLQLALLSTAQQLEVRERLDYLLDRMHYFHYMLIVCLSDYSTYSDLLPQPLNLSLDILHATLTIARNKAFLQHALSFPNYRHSKLVKSQLLQNGWCLSDIHRMYQDTSVLGEYYNSRLGPLDNIMDHSACTEDACQKWQVDRHTYQTRHVSAHCKCSLIAVSTEALAGVLREGSIPCIRLNDAMDAIELASAHSDPLTTFTAISHVWGDGLGNAHANGLLSCQLNRIQQQVNSLEGLQRPISPSSKNQHFWMDTLCVPVGAEFEAERGLAIGHMVKVYKLAETVLILSRELDNIDSRRDACDLSARINRTAWFRRLWTLHEGVLSRRSVFQLRDGSVELSSLAASVNEPKESTALFHSDLLRTIFQETCMPFTKMETFKSKVSRDRIRSIWSAVQWRTTSYQEDETICLANMLDLDLSQILAVNRSDSEACEKRMKALILLQEYFPRDSIFESSHRRDVESLPNMTTAGFRWAPKSFVFRSSSLDQTLARSPLAQADSAGIHIPSLPSFNPMVPWAEFLHYTSISRLEGLSDSAQINFMLALDWDYYYTISWLPENEQWALDNVLRESTVPAIALREDIVPIKKEDQEIVRRPVNRMFVLDSLEDGIATPYDMDSFEWASSEALILAVANQRRSVEEGLDDAKSEKYATIVARVNVIKKMFSTYRKSASEQVKILLTDTGTGATIPTFAVWPPQTRWCIG